MRLVRVEKSRMLKRLAWSLKTMIEALEKSTRP
jgi:hypothetical protein